MSGLFKSVAIMVCLSAAMTASSQAQTTPGQSSTVPAPAKALPRQTPAPVTAPPPRARDAELDLPDTDTAKRLDRKVGDQAVGGADCRTRCHAAYYMCLTADDSGGCPTAWAQCLNACPAHSSNF